MTDLSVGTMPHTVLLYVVSEPGQWSLSDISEDLPSAQSHDVGRAVDALIEAGLLHENSTDGRLWPLRAGKRALQQAS